MDVSADGAVVAGFGSGSPYVWSTSGGLVPIPGLSGSSAEVASGISGDGTTVVGWGEGQAFRWTASTGTVWLGYLPGIKVTSEAWATSFFGDVVVGQANTYDPQCDCNGTVEGFRWTEATGMIGLGGLPGESVWSWASDISADGSRIAGSALSGGSNHAVIWDADDGVILLGAGNFSAGGISSDGSTAVGESNGLAARWSLVSGVEFLGGLDGWQRSEAQAASADGRVVVGGFISPDGQDYGPGFIWDDVNGMRSVQEVLESAGLNLDGMILHEARSISDDGLTVVGWGTNSLGATRAWIAVIPEPNTGLLVMTGLLGLAYRQRRYGRAAHEVRTALPGPAES